jgi:hypothetical protein
MNKGLKIYSRPGSKPGSKPEGIMTGFNSPAPLYRGGNIKPGSKYPADQKPGIKVLYPSVVLC